VEVLAIGKHRWTKYRLFSISGNGTKTFIENEDRLLLDDWKHGGKENER
jgi:hypothetical protein